MKGRVSPGSVQSLHYFPIGEVGVHERLVTAGEEPDMDAVKLFRNGLFHDWKDGFNETGGLVGEVLLVAFG
jgi:hypothetical protein